MINTYLYICEYCFTFMTLVSGKETGHIGPNLSKTVVNLDQYTLIIYVSEC